MSRKATRLHDPSPGRPTAGRGRRVRVFAVIVVFAGVELCTGHDLQAVLFTVLGVGLAGAMVARWVCDDAPLPSVTALLGRGTDHLGGAR